MKRDQARLAGLLADAAREAMPKRRRSKSDLPPITIDVPSRPLPALIRRAPKRRDTRQGVLL